MAIAIGKKEVAWSYIATASSLLANVIPLPFIIYYLDADSLGLWYIFASLSAVAVMFDFGFSVTFARNINYCWNGASRLIKEGAEFSKSDRPNFQLMGEVLTVCKKIYFVLGILVLLAFGLGGTAYIAYVSRNMIGAGRFVAWFLYLAAIYLNIYYAYYSSFLRGVGAVTQAAQNTVAARLAQMAFTVLFLVLGFGLIGACSAYLSYGCIFRLLGKYRFYKYKDIGKHLSLEQAHPDAATQKELFLAVWHNAWREGVVNLANYLSDQANVIICSLFFTLAETGVYSLGNQMATAVATVAAVMYTTYQPQLQASYISNDVEQTKRVMSLIVYLYIVTFALGLSFVVFIAVPLLRVVKPESVVSIPVLLGLSAGQFIIKYRNCYTSYFSCSNRLIYYNAFLFSSILSVVLSLLFVGGLEWSYWGLIISQIASQAAYNFWFWPLKARQEMVTPTFSELFHGHMQVKDIVTRFIRLLFRS